VKRRTRVGVGVYQDQYGLAATVKVKNTQRERRFPPGTDAETIARWQAQQRMELQETLGPTPPRRTMAREIARRVKALQGRVSHAAERSHLKAWLPIIGPLTKRQVKPSHVTAAIARWQAAGKAARTIRHRVRVLRELFAAIGWPSPTLGVALPSAPDPHPVPVSADTIRAVAASLQAGKRHAAGYGSDSAVAYARFLVRATTGQRPSQIMRAQPADLDLERRIWFVRAGKGGTMVPLPLNGEMVRAWKLFAQADAWGEFDARSFSKTIRRHGWPVGIRPYNLRHTFAIDHLLKGADLGDIQGLLGHRQIETTRKFYAPVLTARLTKAVGRRHLGLGTASRTAAAGRGKTAPKRAENGPSTRRDRARRRTARSGRNSKKV
jgi:integrase